MKHSMEGFYPYYYPNKQCVSSCPILNFLSPGVIYPNVCYGFYMKNKNDILDK